jgi:hypothetical protein
MNSAKKQLKDEEEEEALDLFKNLGIEQSALFKLFKPQPKASKIDKMIRLKSILEHEGITAHLDYAKDIVDLGFKKTVEFVLEQRPEISTKQIREMINKKKRTNRHLTDQGALFLVAVVDLGISFATMIPKSFEKYLITSDGAEEVTIIARVTNIAPIRKFIRNDTNEEIVNRTMTIYEKGHSPFSIKVILLGNKRVNIPDEMGLQRGDLIKISGCYVKSTLAGEPVISLSSNGSIVRI